MTNVTKFDNSRYIKAGLDTGNKASHSSRELFRKIMFGISVLAFITHTVYFSAFLSVGVKGLAWFNFASMLCYAVTYVLCMRRRPMFAWYLTSIEVVAHAIAATVFLGWDTGFHLLMILVLPVLCFGYQPFATQKAPIATLVIGLYMWLDWNYRNAIPLHLFPAQITEAMHMTNVFIFLFFLGFLCSLYEFIVRRSEKKLSEYATTDPLTQLKNRRSIMACAEIELARQRRNEEAITIAICDIDHFKRVNDTLVALYGVKTVILVNE